MFNFGKKKKQVSLSEDDKKIIIGLIWCLKPSDLSILTVVLNKAEEGQVGTTKNSAHSIFWYKLTELGLANTQKIDIKETESSSNLLAFSLNTEGKSILKPLIHEALNSGWPPRNGIISSDAIRMLKQYADEGVPQPQSKLAYLYGEGIAVEKDTNEALKLYLCAAEKEDTTALNNLGIIYMAGQGTEKDLAKSLKYFQLAAEKGSVGAMDNLGELYARGLGVEQNPTEAFKWFLMAAKNNHSLATLKVAKCYSNGFGVEQNFADAYIWSCLSIYSGADGLALRDNLAQRIAPEYLQKLDALVSQIISQGQQNASK